MAAVTDSIAAAAFGIVGMIVDAVGADFLARVNVEH